MMNGYLSDHNWCNANSIQWNLGVKDMQGTVIEWLK